MKVIVSPIIKINNLRNSAPDNNRDLKVGDWNFSANRMTGQLK